MIDRDILRREKIEPFDFFNDAKDTLQWLAFVGTPEALAIRERLNAALDVHVDTWAERRGRGTP